MYKCYREGIADERREVFGLPWIVGENALHLCTWVVAGWLLWPVQWAGWPALTIGWAGIVGLIQLLLKKHNCSGCYYYDKLCHLGWGKVSAALFPQDSGDPKTGMRLSLFYVLSPPLILLGTILIGYTLPTGRGHWILLGVYVTLNVALFALRTKTCRVCAQRKVCPGSAVKGRAAR